jgi:hypothetical protein
MPLQPIHRALFLANATVLVTHQIDAAFWHEWELFRIPGGNQVNLLLNLPIIALVLYAQAQVARGEGSAALMFYKLMPCLGALTVVIHGLFFALGHEAFVQPVSLGLLVGTAILSCLQLTALRARPLP